MALDYIQSHAGTLFDPQVVQAFVQLIREGR
jgi:response regulator RpfG family c-di-GMP phosphodiesterase